MTTRIMIRTLGVLLVATTLVSGTAGAKESEQKQPKRSVTVQPSGTVSTTASKPVAPAVSEIVTTESTNHNPLASPMAGEQIKWQVIGGGGTRGTSPSFILSGTIGQTAAGLGTSTNFRLNSGFWQDFGSGSCCVGTTGNVDGVGNVDIADLTFLVDVLFISNPVPPCEDEANVDAVGNIDIADLTYLVDVLFINNPPLPPCP